MKEEKEYKFNHCPNCNSQNLALVKDLTIDNQVLEQVKIIKWCGECKKQFLEFYQFIRTEKLEINR